MDAGAPDRNAPAFKRILLKLSGEALLGDLDYGADPEQIKTVAAQVARVRERGVEVAIVVGAGNIYRGMAGAAAGMDRATADYMGMLATVLNALALQDALEKAGVITRVQSAITRPSSWRIASCRLDAISVDASLKDSFAFVASV